MINNSFILDYDLIKEQNLSIDEFMFLLNYHLGSNYNWNIKILDSLQEKQFIKKSTNEEIILREKAKLLIDFISIDKISSINNKKQLNIFVVGGLLGVEKVKPDSLNLLVKTDVGKQC